MSWPEYSLVVLGPFKAKQDQPNLVDNPPVPSGIPRATPGLTVLLGLGLLYDPYTSNVKYIFDMDQEMNLYYLCMY